jgi:hypothetical protein
MRWAVELDVPFDEQRLVPWTIQGVVRVQSPGTYRPATDGDWYRWTPGRKPIPEGEHWTRLEFDCPNGCPSDVQVREDKLRDAAAKTLRDLHDTREPVFRTTVGALVSRLKSSP